MCVCVREREKVSVYVCVREREREKERVKGVYVHKTQHWTTQIQDTANQNRTSTQIGHGCFTMNNHISPWCPEYSMNLNHIIFL